MASQTPPGKASALRVNVKRRKFESVPSWDTGSVGLSMIRTDEPGWAVVHTRSGVMIAHTRTWTSARDVARLFESVVTRNGRSWDETDVSMIMSSPVVRKVCESIGREHRGK